MTDAPEMMTTIGIFDCVASCDERERRRRNAAEHDVDLLVDDHLLDDAPRYVRHAGVVAHDQLDLLAGDAVAVHRM